MDFIMAANLSLYDLQKGVNGFTGEPIRNDLVGRIPEVYALLESSIPSLARIAFPEEFADAVNEEWLKVIGAVQAEKRETLKPAEKPIDSDIIQNPIENIAQAKEQIIEDARRRILSLDWQHFGAVDLQEVAKLYDAFYPLILRNAGMNFQLNLLHAADLRERFKLDSLFDEYKNQMVDEYWLAMLSGDIQPEEATFIRDWLWMKVPEVIAGYKQFLQKRVVEYFMRNDQSLERAVFRSGRYISKRENRPV